MTSLDPPLVSTFIHLHYAFKGTFGMKTIRYSFSINDNYKFTANAGNKNHTITKKHHFVA